jgi:hypothetical protein
MTTKATGFGGDLKVDKGDMRVWLSRWGLEDGEPYENTVYVEKLFDGKWVLQEFYDGDEQ